jgi:hypothetical protein
MSSSCKNCSGECSSECGTKEAEAVQQENYDITFMQPKTEIDKLTELLLKMAVLKAID